MKRGTSRPTRPTIADWAPSRMRTRIPRAHSRAAPSVALGLREPTAREQVGCDAVAQDGRRPTGHDVADGVAVDALDRVVSPRAVPSVQLQALEGHSGSHRGAEELCDGDQLRVWELPVGGGRGHAI